MRVLVLGSGAKDHAVTWWFSQSRLIDGLFVAPGNVGTEQIAMNLPTVNPSSSEEVYQACLDNSINFVFVGTEAPLFTGVIDYLNERGIATFGAPGRALKLEGDRCFARAFTDRHNIPTPAHHLFSDEESLANFLKRHPGERFVLKRNALAPSRVMVDSSDFDVLMDFARNMMQQDSILVEEHLTGLPVTITVLVDNNGYLMLPICSDYMKAEEGEGGLPTGGMGSISPVPLTAQYRSQIIDYIIKPTLYGMKVERMAYKGVLTFSLILANDGPMLVDYHVRFNDPAAQAIIPLIKSDIVEILEAMNNDTLSEFKLDVSNWSAVAVVIASKGYPEKPQIGKEVKPIQSALKDNVFLTMPLLFFGAVAQNGDRIITSGGRCLTVVGMGENIIEANQHAYEAVEQIHFDGAWYRKDIGNRFFEN